MNHQIRRCLLPVDESLHGHQLILNSEVIRTIEALLPKKIQGVYHENVLYLAGQASGSQAVALTVIAPHATTGPRGYDTPPESHREVVERVGDLCLAIVAQVHCHPGAAVYHSDGDDDLAFIKGEGFWSIVVPSYGLQGIRPLTRCGFHCYSGGAFRQLTAEATNARVFLAPDSIDLRRTR